MKGQVWYYIEVTFYKTIYKNHTYESFSLDLARVRGLFFFWSCFHAELHRVIQKNLKFQVFHRPRGARIRFSILQNTGLTHRM